MMPINYNLLILATIFGNFWIWRVLKENIIVGIFLVILSLLLFNQVTKVQKKQLVALVIVFTILSIFILKSSFDQNIFITSAEEQSLQNTRHRFYAAELGPLFTNKLSLHFYKDVSWSINKLERNLFNNLDINLYFFGSHPRERAGIGEFDKYPWILLPFFLVGLFLEIKNRYIVIAIYLIAASLISMFSSLLYPLGPVLFFPLINAVIAHGLIYCFRQIKNKMEGLKL